MARILLFMTGARVRGVRRGTRSVTPLDDEVDELLHRALRLAVDERLDAGARLRGDHARALERALDAVVALDTLGHLAHFFAVGHAARGALQREALEQRGHRVALARRAALQRRNEWQSQLALRHVGEWRLAQVTLSTRVVE